MLIACRLKLIAALVFCFFFYIFHFVEFWTINLYIFLGYYQLFLNDTVYCMDTNFFLVLLVSINYCSSGKYGASVSLAYESAIDCSIRNKKLTVKPFFKVSEYYLDWHMENIDNQNKCVFALGNTYNPMFTITHYYKHISSTTVQNVNNISLLYNMSFYTLCTQIIIANNRMLKIQCAFNFAFRVSLYGASMETLKLAFSCWH